MAKGDSYVVSDAYDAHCFGPTTSTPPSRPRGGKCLPLGEILDLMEPGNYLTRCPIHEDSQASLSVLITEEGRVVVHCFAGCDWQSIQDFVRDCAKDSQ